MRSPLNQILNLPPKKKEEGNTSDPLDKVTSTASTSSRQNGSTPVDDLISQQAPMGPQGSGLGSCWLHAGWGAIADELKQSNSPQTEKLRALVNKHIEIDDNTGTTTIRFADGTETKLSQGELAQFKEQHYSDSDPNTIAMALEAAWFKRYPEQINQGGQANELWREVFGIQSEQRYNKENLLSHVQDPSKVSAIISATTAGTYHCWAIDRTTDGGVELYNSATVRTAVGLPGSNTRRSKFSTGTINNWVKNYNKIYVESFDLKRLA
ncbi:MAG: hypothetical protein ACKO34_05465 [Vampirovibrionales bacterium]